MSYLYLLILRCFCLMAILIYQTKKKTTTTTTITLNVYPKMVTGIPYKFYIYPFERNLIGDLGLIEEVRLTSCISPAFTERLKTYVTYDTSEIIYQHIEKKLKSTFLVQNISYWFQVVFETSIAEPRVICLNNQDNPV